MLDIVEQSEISVDALEQTLIADELVIARLRARQAETLAVLDQAQIARVDGARSLQDWVAARLDVTADTARSLVDAAKRFQEHPASAQQAAAGEVSFDLAPATARLAAARADDRLVADSAGFDLAAVARLAARHRRVSHGEERRVFRDRFLAIQPSLDESSWRSWGRLPAVSGTIVAAALAQQSDELPKLPTLETRWQRNADALVAMAQDSLEGDGEDRAAAAPTAVVSIFVDASSAGATAGEAGAEIAGGTGWDQ